MKFCTWTDTANWSIEYMYIWSTHKFLVDLVPCHTHIARLNRIFFRFFLFGELIWETSFDLRGRYISLNIMIMSWSISLNVKACSIIQLKNETNYQLRSKNHAVQRQCSVSWQFFMTLKIEWNRFLINYFIILRSLGNFLGK